MIIMQIQLTSAQLKDMIVDTLQHEYSTNPQDASYDDIYKATAFCTRKMLSRRQKEFNARSNAHGNKQIYYLCIEFLMGRSLKTNLFNLGLDKVAAQAFKALGVSDEKIFECEPDAGLGNGGLGRLAACF
ncbi:MAG: glycogen/starch/alpha-glucan phosphorylase, partial [Oscillospiraceae bacterium]